MEGKNASKATSYDGTLILSVDIVSKNLFPKLERQRTMRVCSLFSRISGIDLDFQQTGFVIVWANEFDKDATHTYRKNLG